MSANQKKLLLNEKVEVRQFEKGLRGSWYSGVVVGVSDMCRSVEYDELLAETGDAKLVESISVSNAIEGLHQRRYVSPTYRGHMRPLPPPHEPEPGESKFHFGVCVDVWIDDGWWEGVVLDSDDDANERSVFFPDEIDQGKFSLNQLRLSRVWDEFTDTWTDRGVWILVELMKELEGGLPLPGYLKKVWSFLRQNYGFTKMIAEWTCGIRSIWRKYYMDVIGKMAVKSSQQNFFKRRIQAFEVRKKGNESEDCQQTELIRNLSDSCVGRNDGVLINDGSKKREEERKRLGEPKGKKWSLRSQNKVRQPHPDANGANNTSFLEKQTTDEAIVAESDANVEGEHDQLPSEYCAPIKEVHPVGRNDDVLNDTGSKKKEEERNRLGEPKGKKWSLRSENKVKQPHPNTNGDNNTSYQEKQTIAEAIVAESDANVEGKHDQHPSDDFVPNNEVHPVPLPTRNVSSRIVEKSGSVLVCQDEPTKAPCHPSSKKKITVFKQSHVQNNLLLPKKKFKKQKKNKLLPAAYNSQKNQTVSRRNLRIPIKSGSKFGLVIPTYTQKLRSRRASLVFTIQKKRSNIKRRVSRKFQQYKMNVKCISEEKQKLDDTDVLNEVSTSCRHSAQPVENFGKNVKLKDMVSSPWKRKGKKGFSGSRQRDTICIVCHYGEDLIFCDCCPCSYHMSCIDLQVIPEEMWFCPSCRCGLCGSRNCNSDNNGFANACSQCNRKCHVDCLSKVGRNPAESFCSDACHKIYAHLHQLLGISNPTAVNGLTWTLLRSLNTDCNISRGSRIDNRKKLARALGVIHDCFEPTVEPHSRRDLARDIVFSSVSKLKRLDFHGFYVMVLEKGDELACVATVRIHGKSAAEMPLIATDFPYRRQGMCRILMHELEKLLAQIGVERLVLPAISQLRETWETSFGFSEMPRSERLQLLPYPFLVFQGTMMFQKFLSKSHTRNETTDLDRGPQVPERNTSTAASREHNAGHDNENRLSGLGHKRKPKTSKENILDSCEENDVQRYENVYKRRRILANRDSYKGG